MTEPAKHYRDVLVAFYQDEHHRPTADSTLNELHQHGWALTPRDMLDRRRERDEAAERALTSAESALEAVSREWLPDATIHTRAVVRELRAALGKRPA